MKKISRVLAVDDNEDILFSLKLLLKSHVEKVVTETNPNNIPELMKQHDFDVILLDMNFTQDAISGHEGFFWMEKIIEIDPDAVVIFITAYGDVEKAVNSMKAGAIDFIIKPWQNEKLIATVNSAAKLRASRRETAHLKEQNSEINAVMDQPFSEFIGQSPEMQRVFDAIEKVAKTDASVLILGENGTGKELVARALHRHSKRNDKIFVGCDMGAISETLFESELFGHVRGAFTDAKKDRPGRFEVASNGTLFLDEIGNLSLPMQAKLLTVIEKGQVTRVGANKPTEVDVRLICATNMPIEELMREHKFRQDLLYRINTVEIHLPPLRERIEDIFLLAEHFLAKFVKKYNKSIKGFSSACRKKLELYEWPGNVRELRHAVERAVILSDSNVLEPDDFFLKSFNSNQSMELDSFNLEEIEKTIIAKVLKKYRGNVTQAAKELGLTRTSLYRRLEKHGL
jgi:DNA-binding NtrC family response regulator